MDDEEEEKEVKEQLKKEEKFLQKVGLKSRLRIQLTRTLKNLEKGCYECTYLDAYIMQGFVCCHPEQVEPLGTEFRQLHAITDCPLWEEEEGNG